MLSLGEAIQRLRHSGGLTQKALAERLNVSATYISHLEADRREPSVSFVRALAKEVKAPAGLLLSLLLLPDLPRAARREVEPLLAKLIEIAEE